MDAPAQLNELEAGAEAVRQSLVAAGGTPGDAVYEVGCHMAALPVALGRKMDAHAAEIRSTISQLSLRRMDKELTTAARVAMRSMTVSYGWRTVALVGVAVGVLVGLGYVGGYASGWGSGRMRPLQCATEPVQMQGGWACTVWVLKPPPS